MSSRRGDRKGLSRCPQTSGNTNFKQNHMSATTRRFCCFFNHFYHMKTKSDRNILLWIRSLMIVLGTSVHCTQAQIHRTILI
jgi:hypothetical protein